MNTVLVLSHRHDFLCAVADNRRHEVVRIRDALCELLNVAEEVVTLSLFPTVISLVFRNSEDAIPKKRLESGIARFYHSGLASSAMTGSVFSGCPKFLRIPSPSFHRARGLYTTHFHA